MAARKPHEIMRSRPYYVGIGSFTQAPTQKPQPISMPSGIKPGSGFNIRVSPDASMIGFLYTEDGSVHNERLYLTTVFSLDAFDGLSSIGIDKIHYDPPSSFEFAGSSNHLILQTSQCGRDVLTHLTLREGATPRTFFKGGSVSGFHPLQDGAWNQVLISSTSFIDSSIWQVAAPIDATLTKMISSMTEDGARLGLSPSMVSEF